MGRQLASRSTLADANARQASAVFSRLFSIFANRADRGLRRHLGDAVYLIDPTGLRLSGMGKRMDAFFGPSVRRQAS